MSKMKSFIEDVLEEVDKYKQKGQYVRYSRIAKKLGCPRQFVKQVTEEFYPVYYL